MLASISLTRWQTVYVDGEKRVNSLYSTQNYIKTAINIHVKLYRKIRSVLSEDSSDPCWISSVATWLAIRISQIHYCHNRGKKKNLYLWNSGRNTSTVLSSVTAYNRSDFVEISSLYRNAWHKNMLIVSWRLVPILRKYKRKEMTVYRNYIYYDNFYMATCFDSLWVIFRLFKLIGINY
jgi:hypothetical protein